MCRSFIIGLLILASLTSFAQDLKMEAIYYNQEDEPYKIERKYKDGQSIILVKHTNKHTVLVKRLLSKQGDTTIIQETYYRPYRTNYDEYSLRFSWATASKQNGDSLSISFYKADGSIGDSTLSGQALNNYWDIMSTERVSLILDQKLSPPLDSLIAQESFRAYYVDGFPLKIQTFNSRQQKHSLTNCELQGNRMVCKTYFCKDSLHLYKVDSVRWNADNSEISWTYNRLDWNKSYSIEYLIEGNKLSITADSTKREVHYLEGKGLFQNLLATNLLYTDVLYNLELRLFDRLKPVKEIPAEGPMKTIQYRFDQAARPINQESYKAQELIKRVEYRYP